ncbi:hypothetical protein Fcan01_02147 [Folsomia candida]|uniref:ZP domain-containing protein n=2 Tax=Folsomia candida TaxID=158441 RepID=A0A226EX56_FOLCA|nr:hypothetical protein Fcan01_02147 [Folsomia candida]
MAARTGRETSQGEKTISFDIGGLRMSTNYSFQVLPQDLGQKFVARPSQISLQTKGFSAKATKCLADSSEVAVETGPFFGGRISIEDSTTPGCYVKGNPQSPQTKYTLRIRHKECGSTVVDGSKVTSVIMVQENIPILTHSSRRFVVLCSISPDSFTVSAGVSLPRETSVAKSLDFNRLIRIAPRVNNALQGGRGGGELLGELDHHNQHQDEESAPLHIQDEYHNSIPTNNLQDGSQSQYHVSHLYAEKDSNGAEARGLAVKLHRGTWETFLVFAMVGAAIVASLASVLWFIRSYRNINSAHEETIRRITADDSSSDANSSISYDGSSSSLSNVSYSDTRSEADVELDFEFSEDINKPTPIDETIQDVTLNISSQNSSSYA